MGRIFLLHISIGPIITLFLGGITALLLGHPVWSYIIWVLAAIWLIASLIYSWRKRKESAKKPATWISTHQAQTGKLPSIPDYLLPVVQRYTKGNPITKEIELIPMSGQFWNNLLPSQRDELKQIVEWLGMNWDDYYELMRRMLPKDLKLGSKHKPFEQH